MIVTIDGPAGSGKSSTAREVARSLGFRHLDSGAFYRALTWAALEAGIDPDRWDRLTPDDLAALDISAEPVDDRYRMTAGGRDIGREIRSPAVNAHVSRMARVPAVRAWLLDQLRDAGSSGNLIADGRDMGTVVFPDAELKVFLVCAPEIRATRRLAEHGTPHPSAEELADEVGRLLERDRIDSERAVAPLRRPGDAVQLDTTELTFGEQVAAIVRLARERRRQVDGTEAAG